MKRSLLTLVALLSLSGAILAGCGSSKKASSTATPAPATSTPATSTPAASSGSGTAVTMKNIAFSPASVTVKVGQKITWTNQDNVNHNVTATAGASFKSNGDFGQGGTFSYTPTKAGTISYVCTIHPGMDGKIVVTK